MVPPSAASAADKTSYAQSLTHMIKGNLGAGLLGMGSSFAHLGLAGALVCLPALCLVSGYCVHLIVKSARQVELRSGVHRDQLDYPSLARRALESGPSWARPLVEPLGCIVDAALLMTQVGVCCVYVVFVVDNVTSILASYEIVVSKSIVFALIYPVALLLSFIRTLKRLALASLAANLLQFVGLAVILEFLARNISQVSLADRDLVRPISEMALGFGSTMFAFEGISVVLPIYSRMKQPKNMGGRFGVINLSFVSILILYFAVGLMGYLKFGNRVRDSITLNLPAEPLYDSVRAMFTASILLTYPLQFYVPNEMIWKWTKRNLLSPPPMGPITIDLTSGTGDNGTHDKGNSVDKLGQNSTELGMKEKFNLAAHLTQATSPMKGTDRDNTVCITVKANDIKVEGSQEKILCVDELFRARGKSDAVKQTGHSETIGRIRSIEQLVKDNGMDTSNSSGDSDRASFNTEPQTDSEWYLYEYGCRAAVVTMTFVLAISVPKLNLLMDLIGSFSGAALSLTIPAVIHMATFWQGAKGFKKFMIILVDLTIIICSLMAGLGGSLSSVVSIIYNH